MNRLLKHLRPSGGVALARISALWVGDTIREDVYYVAHDRLDSLFPLLRKMWDEGFIPYWEYVGEVLSFDRKRGFIAVGDVDAPTISIDDLSDLLNEVDE